MDLSATTFQEWGTAAWGRARCMAYAIPAATGSSKAAMARLIGVHESLPLSRFRRGGESTGRVARGSLRMALNQHPGDGLNPVLATKTRRPEEGWGRGVLAGWQPPALGGAGFAIGERGRRRHVELHGVDRTPAEWAVLARDSSTPAPACRCNATYRVDVDGRHAMNYRPPRERIHVTT